MLNLEITEGITAREVMAFVSRLREMRRMGVGLAIENFGAGVSGLASSRRYAADTVKIVRVFIVGADIDRDAAAIVRVVPGVGRTAWP